MTMVKMGPTAVASVTAGHTRSHIPGTSGMLVPKKAWPVRGGGGERENMSCDAVTL